MGVVAHAAVKGDHSAVFASPDEVHQRHMIDRFPNQQKKIVIGRSAGHGHGLAAAHGREKATSSPALSDAVQAANS